MTEINKHPFIELYLCIFQLLWLFLSFSDVKFLMIAEIVHTVIVKIKLATGAALESAQKTIGDNCAAINLE